MVSGGIVSLDVGYEWRVTQAWEICWEDEEFLTGSSRKLEAAEEFVEFVGGVEVGF